MAHDNLGLFDTPPSRGEILVAFGIIAVLVAVFLVTLPFANVEVLEINAFVPLVDAVICVGDIIIATMLYAQAALYRSRALSILASGFLFTGLILVPHALTFPGAFARNGLFGASASSAAWFIFFQRYVFPICVILYATLGWSNFPGSPSAKAAPARIVSWLTGTLAFAVAVTFLVLQAGDRLPAFFVSRNEADRANVVIADAVNIALVIIAIAVVWLKKRSVLDVWLLVSLAGWLTQALVLLTLEARYTVSSYVFFAAMLVSQLSLLLALIVESNRLYVRLALSTAARNRENDVRLMTISAVAAAISHEVGQPLAAVTLSATAGISSLTRTPPNNGSAMDSLQDVLSAGYRAFDVLKSMRATFSRDAGSLSEFSLNGLVRETVSLFNRDLAAQRIALRVQLEEDLRPILANRIQIQRVLVNLLTNAIESFDRQPPRNTRRIMISTSAPDDDTQLLDLSDTGPGIAAELRGRIFDPFFTTKPAGSGLGLSLSRTIAEESGGRLWASPNDGGGTTFHFEIRFHPQHPPEE